MKSLLVLILMITGIIRATGSEANVLPKEALQALNAPDKAILYSLEPSEQPPTGDKILHNFEILGETKLSLKQAKLAGDAVKAAVNNYVGVAPNCFEPRHNLRILSHGHIYDFLLCYKCNALLMYKDDKAVASLGASGSPKVLNALLAGANVPISQTK